jgi:hypothetical protein
VLLDLDGLVQHGNGSLTLDVLVHDHHRQEDQFQELARNPQRFGRESGGHEREPQHRRQTDQGDAGEGVGAPRRTNQTVMVTADFESNVAAGRVAGNYSMTLVGGSKLIARSVGGGRSRSVWTLPESGPGRLRIR